MNWRAGRGGSGRDAPWRGVKRARGQWRRAIPRARRVARTARGIQRRGERAGTAAKCRRRERLPRTPQATRAAGYVLRSRQIRAAA